MCYTEPKCSSPPARETVETGFDGQKAFAELLS